MSLRRPTQWKLAMSCRRPSLSGPACTWTRVLSVGGNLPPCGAAGERSEFNIKPTLGAPLLIFPRCYLLKSFPRVDTSARQRGFEIRVFPLLGELPKAIEPHLPVCQLYRWQLGPSMWTSPFGWASQGKATDPPHVDLPAIVRSQRRGQRWRERRNQPTIAMNNNTMYQLWLTHPPFTRNSSASEIILRRLLLVNNNTDINNRSYGRSTHVGLLHLRFYTQT